MLRLQYPVGIVRPEEEDDTNREIQRTPYSTHLSKVEQIKEQLLCYCTVPVFQSGCSYWCPHTRGRSSPRERAVSRPASSGRPSLLVPAASYSIPTQSKEITLSCVVDGEGSYRPWMMARRDGYAAVAALQFGIFVYKLATRLATRVFLLHGWLS